MTTSQQQQRQQQQELKREVREQIAEVIKLVDEVSIELETRRVYGETPYDKAQS